MRKIVGKIAGKLGYRDWMVRLILSLLAAHYVLAINEPEPFLEFIQLQAYPPLLLQNWLIAFLVFSLIYKITQRLDRKFSWLDDLIQRLLLQILLGFLIPSFILFFFAYLFFLINGIDMLETTYLKLEWWFSILFVILVNCYYIIQYFMRYVLFEKRDGNEVSDGIIVKDGNDLIRMSTREVTHIMITADATVVYTVGGRQHITDKSLTALDAELDRKRFYRINRSQIINRDIIQGYGPASSNRLKLKTSVSETFYVSQRYSAEFKKWWEGE